MWVPSGVDFGAISLIALTNETRCRVDWIVFDVEIIKPVEECSRGWDSTDEMGVSMAAVWEHQGDRMRIYGPDDLEALRERLLRADRITGYNIWSFDFPVVWGLSRPDWRRDTLHKPMLAPKTDDILRRIWQSKGLGPDEFYPRTHGGWKLDDVVAETLGVRKIGDGAQAPHWFRAGQVHRVINYCADDVAIERDLGEFVERWGFVVRNGVVHHLGKWQGA